VFSIVAGLVGAPQAASTSVKVVIVIVRVITRR
jgi:hypothetical protein